MKQTKPHNIPEPPEGFDYWGTGPLDHISASPGPEVAAYNPEWPSRWGWDATSEWLGTESHLHYAIRRGTEIHAKNFSEPDLGEWLGPVAVKTLEDAARNSSLKPHPHAALMALYARDAAETDRPWERWEFAADADGDWHNLTRNPVWNLRHTYRRKPIPPKTIRIGNYDVPEPLRQAPEIGAPYWVPGIYFESFIHACYWRNDKIDNRWLSRGLVHLTKEAAELHAKALLSLTATGEGVES